MAQISDRRVSPFRIVEAFDVIEHVGSCLISRTVRFARGALCLQRREEAFHCCIVPAIARPAHRASDALIGHQPLELFAGVLAATIRVMEQRLGPCPAARSPSSRIGDELRRHRGNHRPSYGSPREEIEDGGHVEQAIRRPDPGRWGRLRSRAFRPYLTADDSVAGRDRRLISQKKPRARRAIRVEFGRLYFDSDPKTF